MEGNLFRSESNISLINSLVRATKELRGFQKHYRIPATPKDGLGFLYGLAKEEIHTDLESKFSALRAGYGFKRKEISVNDPDEAVGSIETPFFDYEFSISYLENDASKVRLRRTIKKIHESSQILNPVFTEIFGKQFNSLELCFPGLLQLSAIIDCIEELDSEEISVDYDKDLIWCVINFGQGTPAVHLQGNRLQISSPLMEASPADLLKTLAEAQQLVLQTLKFDAFEVSHLLP